MEESRFPKIVLNCSQRGEKREREIVDDPGDAGKIYEIGTGNNAQTIDLRRRKRRVKNLFRTFANKRNAIEELNIHKEKLLTFYRSSTIFRMGIGDTSKQNS